MKDAKGHGSSGKGGASGKGWFTADVAKGFAKRIGANGDQPVSSNAEAAQALMSGLKSTMVPTHDAMTGVGPNDPRVGSRDYDAFGRPRSADSKSEYDEGSRDMALRSRNGQIGSGVKFRG